MGNNGWWENEQWTPLESSQGDTLAVMETQGELQVVLPSTLSKAACARFLDQFTNCQDITFGEVEGDLFYALVSSLKRLPNINKFDRQGRLLGYSINIPQNHYELASLRLHHAGDNGLRTLLNASLSTQLNSLVDLDLTDMQITITDLMHVLAGTPILQTIRISSVIITETEQELVTAIWASKNLRRVSLGLYLKCHNEDLHGYSSWNWLSRAERDNIKACTTDIAIALAPIFLEQLNSQSDLRELELSFNNRLHPRLSPFLQLSLDPVHGLPRLSNLKKLEKLVITGLAHRLGQQEIEWMSRYWPRLRWIEVPILDCWVDPTEAVSCTRHSFSAGQEVVAPKYDQWFSRLHVAIPIDCHSCGKCWDLMCACCGLYEAGDITHEEWGELVEEYDYGMELEAACQEAAELAAELQYEAFFIDPLDDLYLGRHHQHRSGFRPNPKQR